MRARVKVSGKISEIRIFVFSCFAAFALTRGAMELFFGSGLSGMG